MLRAHILLVVIGTFSLTAGAIHSPAFAESLSQTRSMDDAMLLMIASHSMSEEEDGPAQTNLQKIGRMQNIYRAASARTLKFNEIAYLRDQVRDFCLQGKALVTAHLTGEDECIRVGILEMECGKTTQWLDEQAEELERARRRRARYRGIGGGLRRFRNAVRGARPGQAIRWFAKEVIPEVAKAALTGGVELKGRALQHFGKKVLRKKVQRAVQYGMMRRLAAKQAALANEESLNSIVVRAAKGWTISSAELQEIKKRCEGDSKESQTEGTTSDTCAGDYSWINEYWGIVQQLLVEDGRNCQPKAAHEYRSCLENKAAEGLCKDAAIVACELVFAGIPPNDSGGSVTMTGQTIFLDANTNEATITYPSAGGEVSGRINFQRYDDVFGCTFTLTTTKFVGQYDPTTCTMSGEATSELLYEGYCVSVCGSGPFSTMPSCPVTLTRTCVWNATLEDGVLSGRLGDQSCDRGSFDFQAPGYGIGP